MSERASTLRNVRERAGSSVNFLDLAIYVSLFMAAMVISIWLVMFLNLGKDIESYKKIIDSKTASFENITEVVKSTDLKIEQYIQLLSVMSGK